MDELLVAGGFADFAQRWLKHKDLAWAAQMLAEFPTTGESP